MSGPIRPDRRKRQHARNVLRGAWQNAPRTRFEGEAMHTQRVQVRVTDAGTIIGTHVTNVLSDNPLVVRGYASGGTWYVEVRDRHEDLWQGCRTQVANASAARTMVRAIADTLGRVH